MSRRATDLFATLSVVLLCEYAPSQEDGLADPDRPVMELRVRNGLPISPAVPIGSLCATHDVRLFCDGDAPLSECLKGRRIARDAGGALAGVAQW